MTSRRSMRVALLSVALVLVGCTSEKSDGSAGRSTTTAKVETAPDDRRDCFDDQTGGPPPSSPVTFDGEGKYAVHVKALDDTITFDVVQWLSGDDAVRAFAEDHPGDPDAATGPPNDYWIRNASPQLRDLAIAPDATFWLAYNKDGTSSIRPQRASRQEFAARLRPELEHVSWLTVRRGAATEVCEQWVP